MIRLAKHRGKSALKSLHKVAALLPAAMATGGISHGELVEDLARKEATLWLIYDKRTPIGVFVTSLYEDGAGDFVGVYALSGKGLWRWARKVEDAMVAHARGAGVERVCFIGRVAWRRLMPWFDVTGSRDGQLVYERFVR